MAITKEKKKELITQHQKHKKDSGSPEVQISILTERITNLTDHLGKCPKDHQAKRGLLIMVGKRKSHLNYLKNINIDSYRRTMDQLAIRT